MQCIGVLLLHRDRKVLCLLMSQHLRNSTVNLIQLTISISIAKTNTTLLFLIFIKTCYTATSRKCLAR